MEAGRRLGPYLIREKIGAGGMGEVYLAEDRGCTVRWRSRCCRRSTLATRNAWPASIRRPELPLLPKVWSPIDKEDS